MISIRPSVVSLRAGDEMKLEFYLESSSMKISSLSSSSSSNPIRSMSSIANSRDVLDDDVTSSYHPAVENINLSSNLHGLDETKAL